MNVSDLPSRLAECNTEEEVKSEFARAFKFKLDTRYRMDLYTPNALFEFKFEKNFQSLSARAQCVAQVLYYIREIKFGTLDLVVPRYICLVDKNESFILETKDFRSIFRKFFSKVRSGASPP